MQGPKTNDQDKEDRLSYPWNWELSHTHLVMLSHVDKLVESVRSFRSVQ